MSLEQYHFEFPDAESIQAPLLPESGLEHVTHKVAFRPYGDSKTAKKIIITVHGLTGDSLNFHYLSEYVTHQHKDYAVINIDIMGRGESGSLANDGQLIPSKAFSYAQYVEDVVHLLKHIRSQNSNPDVKWFWVGTSMGGLLGMMLAEKFPVLKESGIIFSAMMFNDIGPLVPWGEIERIAKYVIIDTPMPSREHATEYFESLYKSHFGPKTDTRFFAHRALHALIYNEELKAYQVKYDRHGVQHGLTNTPAETFVEHPQLGKCFSCQPFFSLLDIPVLVYRGELSVLLPQVLLDEMEQEFKSKHVDFKSVVWPHTGHTPPLYEVDEFEPILDWFEKH